MTLSSETTPNPEQAQEMGIRSYQDILLHVERNRIELQRQVDEVRCEISEKMQELEAKILAEFQEIRRLLLR